MAKITLKNATTFSRFNGASGKVVNMTLPAGEEVNYERTQDGAEHVHTVTVTRDGYKWTATRRTPVSAPVAPQLVAAATPKHSAQTDEAMKDTAHTAGAAFAAVAGKQVAGIVNAREREAKKAIKLFKLLSGKIYTVNFYIPVAWNDKCPNPTYVFDQLAAFHWDGSHWYFTEEGINDPRFQEVKAHWDRVRSQAAPGERKMRYSIVEWTPGQIAAEKEVAQEAMAEKLQDAHTSMLEQIDNAYKRLGEAQAELDKAEAEGASVTERDRAKLIDARNGALRGAIRSACNRFEMALRGAEMFDTNDVVDDLFHSTRDAIAAAALAVNAVLTAQRTGTGRPVKGVDVPDIIASAPAATAPTVSIDRYINGVSVPPAKQD
jgi:hypothetical protein